MTKPYQCGFEEPDAQNIRNGCDSYCVVTPDQSTAYGCVRTVELGLVSKVAGSELWGRFENPLAARIAALRWCLSWIPSRVLISFVTMTQGVGWRGSRVGYLWSVRDAGAVLS